GARGRDRGGLPRGRGVTTVVFDADVLGRQRTGDETYAANLLRELASLAPDAGLRLAAVTRRPDLVPEGVEAVVLPARGQEWRMACTLPRRLRELPPGLRHFQHAIPLACPCSAVVTVHDLSFARAPSLMPLRDRVVFRLAVRRAVRRAERVLTVSERSRRDVLDVYGVAAERVVVTPNGVDPAFLPGDGHDSYALFAAAIPPPNDPLP